MNTIAKPHVKRLNVSVTKRCKQEATTTCEWKDSKATHIISTCPNSNHCMKKKLFGGAPIPGTGQRMQGQLTTRGKKQRNMIHTVKQLLQQAKCLIQAKSSYSNLPNIRLKIP